MQFQIPIPEDVRIPPITNSSPPGLSPDGRWIAFIGSLHSSAEAESDMDPCPIAK